MLDPSRVRIQAAVGQGAPLAQPLQAALPASAASAATRVASAGNAVPSHAFATPGCAARPTQEVRSCGASQAPAASYTIAAVQPSTAAAQCPAEASPSPARIVEPGQQQPTCPTRKALLSSQAAWREDLERQAAPAAPPHPPDEVVPPPLRWCQAKKDGASVDAVPPAVTAPPAHGAAAAEVTATAVPGSAPETDTQEASCPLRRRAAPPATALDASLPPPGDGAATAGGSLGAGGAAVADPWVFAEVRGIFEVVERRVLAKLEDCLGQVREEREARRSGIDSVRAELSTAVDRCRSELSAEVRSVASELRQDQSTRGAVASELEELLGDVRSGEQLASQKMEQRLAAMAADAAERAHAAADDLHRDMKAQVALARQELVVRLDESEERCFAAMETGKELLELKRKATEDSLADVRIRMREADELLHGRVDVLAREQSSRQTEPPGVAALEDLVRCSVLELRAAAEAAELKHGEEFGKLAELSEGLAERLIDVERDAQAAGKVRQFEGGTASRVDELEASVRFWVEENASSKVALDELRCVPRALKDYRMRLDALESDMKMPGASASVAANTHAGRQSEIVFAVECLARVKALEDEVSGIRGGAGPCSPRSAGSTRRGGPSVEVGPAAGAMGGAAAAAENPRSTWPPSLGTSAALEERMGDLEARLVKRHENLVQTLNKDIGRLEVRFDREVFAATPDASPRPCGTAARGWAATDAGSLRAELQDQGADLGGKIHDIGEYALGEVAALRGDTERKFAEVRHELDRESRERVHQGAALSARVDVLARMPVGPPPAVDGLGAG